ncbi:Hoc-like head decoration [Escherichia phage HK2]
MPTLKVGFNKTTNVATVLDASGSIPGGSVEVGTFVHPDATYPDSLVIFHGVRDLLYKRSAKDPSKEGFWPNNIVDMQSISIDMKATPRLTIVTKLPRVVSAIEGEGIDWHVDVAGGKAPFTYKWQFKANTAGAAFADISSSTNPSAVTATLTLNDVAATSAGTYKVIVTDANGTTVEDETLLAVGYYVASSLVATPASLDLSVAADTTNGKTVTIVAMPVGSSSDALSIKTAPESGRATATIAGNVLTVKPVAAGEATSVVVTNGKVDVTIPVTVAE